MYAKNCGSALYVEHSWWRFASGPGFTELWGSVTDLSEPRVGGSQIRLRLFLGQVSRGVWWFAEH